MTCDHGGGEGVCPYCGEVVSSRITLEELCSPTLLEDMAKVPIPKFRDVFNEYTVPNVGKKSSAGRKKK